MNTDMMTNLYRPGAPWEWPLRRSQATRLDAAPVARWLQVTSGRVWLTESGSGPDGDDVWLRAGERQMLPAGSEWVIEGWPEARIEVLEAPAVSARPRWRAWLAAA